MFNPLKGLGDLRQMQQQAQKMQAALQLEEVIIEKNGVKVAVSYTHLDVYKRQLTSNRNSQNTLWWYTISCPRDPETSVGICLPDTTTKTISGTVKLDPVVAQLCKNNDCIASIQVKQDATAPLIKWAQGPDYTYHFPAVKALSLIHI